MSLSFLEPRPGRTTAEVIKYALWPIAIMTVIQQVVIKAVNGDITNDFTRCTQLYICAVSAALILWASCTMCQLRPGWSRRPSVHDRQEEAEPSSAHSSQRICPPFVRRTASSRTDRELSD